MFKIIFIALCLVSIVGCASMYRNQQLERCAKLCQRTTLDVFEDDDISCTCKDKVPRNKNSSY